MVLMALKCFIDSPTIVSFHIFIRRGLDISHVHGPFEPNTDKGSSAWMSNRLVGSATSGNLDYLTLICKGERRCFESIRVVLFSLSKHTLFCLLMV